MPGYLKCECGSDFFVKVHRLRHLQSGGIADEVAGERCSKCGNHVNRQQLVREQDLIAKKAEIERLGKEIADNAQAGKTEPGRVPDVSPGGARPADGTVGASQS